ncbi:VOC family protein [Streptomyces monticola]|uniref:VOC family protein n=1 Tax=Streptomyces monticola TaxID=2666263 RepID=A0ABW2JK97_9ACTN
MKDNTARLDHVVLWVNDPLAAVEFYEKTLGFTPVRADAYAEGKAPFPSVRLNDETIFDLMAREKAPRMAMVPEAAASSGHPVNHICIALTAVGFDALHARLEEHGVPMSEISHDAFGALGNAQRSFYFRDPDGNIFEGRHYDTA